MDGSSAPLFSLLTPEERAQLEGYLTLRRVAAGEQVFSMGDPGDALYVVSTGAVEIFLKNREGHRIALETCSPGEVFGELSLLDGGPRTASALAVQDTVLLALDRDGLDSFLRLSPGGATHLLAATGRRLRHTTRLLGASSVRSATAELVVMTTPVERMIDRIAGAAGSLKFLVAHLVFFLFWTSLNGWLAHQGRALDPPPFGLLNLGVGLEAIVLSVIVLLSQSREATREKLRDDIEYEVNVRAELGIAALHEKVDDLRSDMLVRFEKRDGR